MAIPKTRELGAVRKQLLIEHPSQIIEPRALRLHRLIEVYEKREMSVFKRVANRCSAAIGPLTDPERDSPVAHERMRQLFVLSEFELVARGVVCHINNNDGAVLLNEPACDGQPPENMMRMSFMNMGVTHGNLGTDVWLPRVTVESPDEYEL